MGSENSGQEIVDTYLTISKSAEGIYKEKGSRFLSFAYPVECEEEISFHNLTLRKTYHDARHVCFAWRLDPAGGKFRVADDGEPSHSAGTPILNAIRSRELTNVLVSVVRYFGGTKLGVGGLIEAYGMAAKSALDSSPIVQKFITKRITVFYKYGMTGEFRRICSRLKIQPAESQFGEKCVANFAIRLSEFESVKKAIASSGFEFEE